MVDVPVTICTAQLHVRSDLCFISLIKISELGSIAWILCSSSSTPQLESQVLHTPIRSEHCISGWGGCWHRSAGEQAAGHCGGESREAYQQQRNPPGSRLHQRPGVQARVLPICQWSRTRLLKPRRMLYKRFMTDYLRCPTWLYWMWLCNPTKEFMNGGTTR